MYHRSPSFEISKISIRQNKMGESVHWKRSLFHYPYSFIYVCFMSCSVYTEQGCGKCTLLIRHGHYRKYRADITWWTKMCTENNSSCNIIHICSSNICVSCVVLSVQPYVLFHFMYNIWLTDSRYPSFLSNKNVIMGLHGAWIACWKVVRWMRGIHVFCI